MKYTKFLFTIYILLLSIGTAFSQTVEVQGFLPNKGQFGEIEKGILGKLCGIVYDKDTANNIPEYYIGGDLWLTEAGLDFVYYVNDAKAIHKQRVINSNPIKFDSIELYDSSNNVINYYLSDAPEGILNIRGYKKIVIKSILDNVDWEIMYEPAYYGDFHSPFTHRFISKQPTSSKIEVILHTMDANNSLNGYPNSIEDTLLENTKYELCKYLPVRSTMQVYYPKRPDSSISWKTDYGLSYIENFPEGYPNWLDFYSTKRNKLSGITSITTDNRGDLYVAGHMYIAEMSYRYDTLSNDSLNYLEDAFISKFKDGVLLWTTIYGSSANDAIGAIEVSSNNFIYASGHIEMNFLEDSLRKMAIADDFTFYDSLWDNDFPLQKQSNSFFSDTGSLFILKFNTDGIRQWATLLGKDYGIINDNGRKRPYIIDCGITSSTINSKDDIYFSGTYRPSIYRSDINDPLPNIAQIESALGLPIDKDGTDSTWTMEDINSRSPNRFSGTNQWNSYPFILKIDSTDNLVWSTYFFSTQPILAMDVDSKNNLYIGGNTIDGNLPTKEKSGALFNDKSFLPANNLNRAKDMERRSYIAEFDSSDNLIWCTYLESQVDSNSKTYISDLDIDYQDKLLLTGYTTNKKFSFHKKEGAYYVDFDSIKTTNHNAFIMVFEDIGSLLWSTLFPSYWDVGTTATEGLNIEGFIDGRIRLLVRNINTRWTSIGYVDVIEFESNYKIRNGFVGSETPYLHFAINPSIMAPDILGLEKQDYYNDIERYSNTNAVHTLTGNSYVSIYRQVAILDDIINFHGVIQENKTQFRQSSAFSSVILGIKLCASIDDFPYYFKDTTLCVDNEIDIKFDSLVLDQFSISWYKNNVEIHNGTSYTIKDNGVYHFVANNIIYSDCPDYYSDTVSIAYIYDTIDLNFPEDTVALCVGDSIHVISAYSLGATYLWSDNSTDSTYTISYKGDSIDIIWCEATNNCGGEDRDSVIVRFYPPYAYLGEDTMLCKGQVLNFDASILNQNVPAELVYKWFFNGESVLGSGTNNELFTITEKYSGQLVLHAIWKEMEEEYNCERGIDTLNFSYYQYDNVDFYIPEDTTICFYEEIEVDLIANKTNNIDTNNIYLCLNSRGDTISKESNFILKEPFLYYISASNYCSKQEDTLKLNHFTDFKIEKLLPTDTILCKGDSLTFDASILNNNIPDTVTLEYEWFLNGESVPGSGTSNELFTITENDTTQLVLCVVWQESGCELGMDTLNFSYYQYDNVYFDPLNDTSICFYAELEIDLIANKTDNIDPNTIYLCLSNSDIISKKSKFVLREPLSYNISATNYCSKQEQIFKLSHFDDLNIKMLLPTDTAICKELFPAEIPALTTEQIDGKCYWLSENKKDTIEIAPSRYVSKDGIYPIILADIYNCSQNYDITVSLKEDCSPIIDMPNVFTPNSDGINDLFKIISADNIKDFDIIIFNKAGTKVYEYKGLIENFAWNGTYKNTARDVPEGAYFFVILYKDVTNATRKQAGTITLLR